MAVDTESAVSSNDIAELRSRLTMLARRLRREARNDALSWSKMLIISLVDRLGGRATPTMLACAENISSANVAALLRELESGGLIERSRDAADGRKIWISLSERGNRVLADSRSARERWLLRAMEETLSPSEQSRLIASGELIERIAKFDRP